MKNINPAIDNMIAHKQLSEKKIELLAFLKGYIDRIAGCNYLSDAELEKIELKYGVKPDIISWGDYFQSRIAGEHWEKSDAEFEKIIRTVQFDMVAAVMIFEKKSPSFIEMVKDRYADAQMKPEKELTVEEQEYLHLGIILNYYENLRLRISAYDKSDFDFFKYYAADQAVG